MEEMPEDLVCKFLRCISVGSWQDPWRINGPARMKGRERRRRESFLSRKSLSSICGEQCLSLSLFFNFSLWSRQFQILRSLSLSLSFFDSSRLRSNRQIRESIPFIREGTSAFGSKKEEKNRCLGSAPSFSVSLSLLCSSQTFGIDERCIPWNVSMLPLSPPIPSLSRKQSRSTDPHVNRPSTILQDLTIRSKYNL